MATFKTLEEDLQDLGLIENGPESRNGLNEVSIARKAKTRRHRPKHRTTAAEKARGRLSAKKARRSASGKKMARIRAKAMKKARKMGLKPGRISIITAKPKTIPVTSSRFSRTDNLIEELGRIADSLDGGIGTEDDLVEGFESAVQILQYVSSLYETLEEAVEQSNEFDEQRDRVDEVLALAETALEAVQRGKKTFRGSDGEVVEMLEVLEDLVDEVDDIVDEFDDIDLT